MTRVISIVGAGRLGTTLARRLRGLGWSVGAVVTRSSRTSRAAVRKIGAGTPRGRLTREALVADLILVTVPDDELKSVASSLAKLGGEQCRGRIVLHASATLDHSVLAPLERLGAWTGSLHPMQTFTGRESHRSGPNLDGVTFAVEGNPGVCRAALAIARSLGGVPVEIDSRDKPIYHAAAVFVCGSGFPLVELALQMLVKIGFTRRRAMQTLLPLTRQMLDNVERIGPRAAWTGPLSRRDYAIVAKHTKALRSYPPDVRQAYAILALLAVRLLSKHPVTEIGKLKRALAHSMGGNS
jgi:predicted short-subunit dehydrogenase-like oxidoreductase (DUF2520 family)